MGTLVRVILAVVVLLSLYSSARATPIEFTSFVNLHACGWSGRIDLLGPKITVPICDHLKGTTFLGLGDPSTLEITQANGSQVTFKEFRPVTEWSLQEFNLDSLKNGPVLLSVAMGQTAQVYFFELERLEPAPEPFTIFMLGSSLIFLGRKVWRLQKEGRGEV